MKVLSVESEVAWRTLMEIAHGTGSNGTAYNANELRKMAMDALQEMQLMQWVDNGKNDDRGDW